MARHSRRFTISKPSYPPPREILASHHRGLATDEAVARSLIAYAGWVVPVTWMALLGREELGRLAMYGEETKLPPGELWLFTDFDAATLAASTGARLGAYATGPPGIEVFRRVNDRWTWDVKINPFSPPEATWSVSRDLAGLPEMWCDMFELEETLALSPHPDRIVRAKQIFEFRFYWVLFKADGAGVTFTAGSPTEILPLFTAQDRIPAFMNLLGEAAQDLGELTVRISTGPRIFEYLAQHGQGKVAINPDGHGSPCIIDLDEFRRAQ